MQHRVLGELEGLAVEHTAPLQSPAKLITVIIPIRVDETNDFRLSRLSYILQDHTAAASVDVLVADDGSPARFARSIEMQCRALGFQYERLETSHLMVSMARARNRAAQIAATPFIFFMDADLLPPAGFFQKLASEVRVQKLEERAEDMVMVPVSYLTQAATEDYLHNDGAARFDEFLEHTINRNRNVIERYSSGTSACVYNRLYYLARGGHVEDFAGWGYEDLEFNLRVARLTKRFPMPRDYTADVFAFDDQYYYRGWKALYRLFGDRSLLKGLMLLHAWHPLDTQSGYHRQRTANKKLFDKQIAAFATNGTEPEPLPDLHHGRSLLLKSSAFTCTREVRPMLGEVVAIAPENLPSDEHLADMLQARRIDRIVFQNPYRCGETQRIYDWARRSNFPFLICERGALPGTVLFDSTGFLADSARFDPEHWDRPLTETEQRELEGYLQQETTAATSLEAQAGLRMHPAELRSALGVTSADRLVLVLLQRPSDTATKHFPGALGTYPDFVWALERISKTLPPDVRIAFKVHPLEDHVPDIDGTDVSGYHINDLMAVADKVVTFTSGTGALAMLWRLPVVVAGNAFYKHPRLTHEVCSDADLRDLLCAPLTADTDAYDRFLHYLRFRYYSVGAFTTRPVRMPSGDRMTATTGIRFQCIRGFGQSDLSFAFRSAPEDRWQSMLFDRYVAAKSAPASGPSKRPVASKAPRWGTGKRIVHRVAVESIGRMQGYEMRQRMQKNPIDFFKKAKWGPNRFIGRILLDKSERPY